MTSPYDLPDYHALIRGIRQIDLAGGDSTLARLVTADWLQDHGEEERAFFARIHVRYEAIWQDDTPERDEISELLKGPYSVTRFASPPFAPDCPRRLDPKPDEGLPRTWDWMGGWVRVVRTPLAWWLAHGPDICRRHPVQEVVITNRTAAEHRPEVLDPVRHPPRRPFWYRGECYIEQHWIHPDVFDWLEFDPGLQPPPATTGYFAGVPRSDSAKYYRNRGDATAAMNVAAIRWAEAEADRITTTRE